MLARKQIVDLLPSNKTLKSITRLEVIRETEDVHHISQVRPQLHIVTLEDQYIPLIYRATGNCQVWTLDGAKSINSVDLLVDIVHTLNIPQISMDYRKDAVEFNKENIKKWSEVGRFLIKRTYTSTNESIMVHALFKVNKTKVLNIVKKRKLKSV